MFLTAPRQEIFTLLLWETYIIKCSLKCDIPFATLTCSAVGCDLNEAARPAGQRLLAEVEASSEEPGEEKERTRRTKRSLAFAISLVMTK